MKEGIWDIMGVGVDILRIERMARALTRNPALRKRLFSVNEQAYCEARGRPAQHYAVRFAAKEAVAKALGHSFSWQDVEIVKGEKGAPVVVLHNLARSAAAGRRVKVSLSHCDEYAIACAIVE
jgi:holo-[acyl-carrier protein] synthase